MLDKLDAALRFQQEALNLRAQRQEVLAANIANADTPGYQARDIDFASELKKVMQRGRDATSVVALTMTSTQHIPAQALTPPTAELQYRIPDQPSLDGNTVDMDRERTQFADNSLQYQMSLSALSGQIKGMMNVLQLNLQSKCNKKRSTHQLEYNFVSTQKPFPNDEYFLPTSYNKRARKDNDFTRTGQKTSRNCQSTGT